MFGAYYSHVEFYCIPEENYGEWHFFFRVSNTYLLHAYNSMEPYTFCHA